MSDLPRFALGTVQPTAELCPVLWGLLDAFQRLDWQLQTFASSARLDPLCGIRCTTGRSQRHLDSWMMSKATCREIFSHGSQGADMSLVAGRFDSARAAADTSSLNTLCQWLDLPSVAVIDVARLASCNWPVLPSGVSALFLDRVRDQPTGQRWRTNLEAHYGVPVIGWLDANDGLRELARDCKAPAARREAFRALGERIWPTMRWDRWATLTQQRQWPSLPERLFRAEHTDDPITIAVGFDAAFQGYFADTLDLLEARGARICDFSPLRSEALPWDADIVYLAGSNIHEHAEELSHNHCFKQNLRHFVQRGGRVYAEGDALAYLCEHVESPEQGLLPMVGLIPAVAHAELLAMDVTPAEISLRGHCWLGTAGTTIRGYLNPQWSLAPLPGLINFSQQATGQHDLVGTSQVVGSRLQVDFAGQPHLISSFFRPRLDALVGIV